MGMIACITLHSSKSSFSLFDAHIGATKVDEKTAAQQTPQIISDSGFKTKLSKISSIKGAALINRSRQLQVVIN